MNHEDKGNDLDDLIQQAIANDTWMICRTVDGKCDIGCYSAEGVQWNPIGQWTEHKDGGIFGTDRFTTHNMYSCSLRHHDLDFCIYDPRDVVRVKDGLQVRRAMVAMRNQLPSGLVFQCDVDLSWTNIKELPDGLKVNGNLDIAYTKISELPANLKVDGNLNITCIFLENIEDGEDTPATVITNLPPNLTVGGTLDLRETKIKQLPTGLKVGTLDISQTEITRLPPDLEATCIYLNTEIPSHLKDKCDVTMIGTDGMVIADNITIKGDLCLAGCNIRTLPYNLTVEGNLDLGGTRISEIPDSLKVHGGLSLIATNITQLPPNFTVGEDLYLNHTQIDKLPPGLTVGGDLFLIGTNIDEYQFIRSHVKVGGICHMKKLLLGPEDGTRYVPDPVHSRFYAPTIPEWVTGWLMSILLFYLLNPSSFSTFPWVFHVILYACMAALHSLWN